MYVHTVYTYIHTVYTYIHTVYVCTYCIYIHTNAKRQRITISYLAQQLGNYNPREQLANAHLVSLHRTEGLLRGTWGRNKEFLTSSLKRHGACAHSGVVMSREELTLCARFLRGGGCRSVSGAVSCGQARELSMTSAHSQTHTKAMSCHLYTCTCKWWDSPIVCICGVCGANTTRLCLGCGQSRQTRGAAFTEELKAEKDVPKSMYPVWPEHDLTTTLHQHSLPSLLHTPVHASLPITTTQLTEWRGLGVGGIDKFSTSIFLEKYCGITTYLLLE